MQTGCLPYGCADGTSAVPPAPLTRRCLRPRRPLPPGGEAYWIAACAGMTPRGTYKGAWIPAFAGMTRRGWPPGEAWKTDKTLQYGRMQTGRLRYGEMGA